MRKTTPLFSLVSIAVVIALNSSCTRIEPLTGDVVDTPNRIAGSVAAPPGEQVAGTVVRLRSVNYAALPNSGMESDTQSTKETVTDASGAYRFNNVPVGAYTIEMSSARNTGAAVRCTIPDNRTAITLAPATLKPVGILRGVIPPEQRAGSEWFVQVLGLERFTAADPNTGAFVFNDIPEGDYTVRQIAMKSNTNPVLIENIHLPAGMVVTVPYAAWKYSKQLFLNTTPAGADIAGNVYGFPVLIRVSADTTGNVKYFDFRQAGVNGRDVRFAKSDGTPLTFETERWDSNLKRAEVWVRVDTIYGNDSTRSIMMFWGNPDAAGASNGPAVFDSKKGFVGVWHLNEATGSNTADATGNGYYGIPKSGPTADKGRIGLAKRFDGVSQYINFPNTAAGKTNFSENSTYTISAWVFVDTTLAARQVLLAKGPTQFTLEIRDTNRWAFSQFKDLAGWEIARSNWDQNSWNAYTRVTSKTWTLVTGVRSNGRQYLYINDGLCTDTANQFIRSVRSRLTSCNLTIGRVEGSGAEGPCYFGGKIDEVRISTTVPSRDYIRLCFRNQNHVDRLIQVR